MENNWKMKCVDNNGNEANYELGEICMAINGIIFNSFGVPVLGDQTFENFEQFDNYSKAEWIFIETERPDAINPSHYKECSLECIDAMLMAFGADHVYMYCCITAWKYMWRYQNKNGIEDIKKARWYIEKAKELGHDQPEVWNLEYVLEKIEKVKGIPLC